MTTTLDAIADNARRPDALIVAGEVVDLVHQKEPLSLRASKLLHLLVQAAGADACDPVRHSILAESLNQHFHLSLDTFIDTCSELMRCLVRLQKQTAKGRTTLKAAPMLSYVQHDRDDGTNDDPKLAPAMIYWEFSPLFREVLADSIHWTALSRKAVLAIEGRYSLRLYEWMTLRKGLARKSKETLTLDALRSRLGVEHGKLKTWSDFRVRALDPAIAEVVQLSGLSISYDTITIGKRVVEVTITWNSANPGSREEAKRELERSRVGRKVRRAGTVDQMVVPLPEIAPPSKPEPIRFPADGQFRGTAFEAIARAALPAPTRDFDLVGRDFVAWAKEGSRPLAGDHVTRMFAGFCRTQKPA